MLILAPFSLSLWPEGQWLWGIQPCGLSGYRILRLLINILSTEFVLPKNLTDAGFCKCWMPTVYMVSMNTKCLLWTIFIVCVVPKNIDCLVDAQSFHEHRIPSVCAWSLKHLVLTMCMPLMNRTLSMYCMNSSCVLRNTEYLVYVCSLLTLNTYWMLAYVNIMWHPCCHLWPWVTNEETEA